MKAAMDLSRKREIQTYIRAHNAEALAIINNSSHTPMAHCTHHSNAVSADIGDATTANTSHRSNFTSPPTSGAITEIAKRVLS